MSEYLDAEGNELTRGFYGIFGGDALIYFSGKYDEDGKAIFKNNEKVTSFNTTWVREMKLKKFSNEDIQNLIKFKKNQIGLLEKALKYKE